MITVGTYKVNNNSNPLIEVNEFKKSLIIYYQNQATGQRVQAAIAKRAYVKERHDAKAETYDIMVKYLQGLGVIE